MMCRRLLIRVFLFDKYVSSIICRRYECILEKEFVVLLSTDSCLGSCLKRSKSGIYVVGFDAVEKEIGLNQRFKYLVLNFF